MITFHWAYKVFTASLFVKKTHYLLSHWPQCSSFFIPFFQFSIHILISLAKKKESFSVNTVGSLLMLEPDDGVVGELKDKDKDRKDWKLG